MSISDRVNQFLVENEIPFDTINHAPSHNSVQTAINSQLPMHAIPKAVILKDSAENYVMAVIPTSGRLHIKHASAITSSSLKMASERDVMVKFSDCQKGAIPPFGVVYNMATLWDESLMDEGDLYLEGGDHKTLIHITQKEFKKIIKGGLKDSLCTRVTHKK